jgi:predicted nucleic acid-binding protein
MVDSNVLVYAIDPADPMKQSIAQDVLTRLEETGRGVLCAQVLGEYFRVATQRIATPLPYDQAERRLLTLSTTFPVYDTTMVAIREGARAVRVHGMSFLGWGDLGCRQGQRCRISPYGGSATRPPH